MRMTQNFIVTKFVDTVFMMGISIYSAYAYLAYTTLTIIYSLAGNCTANEKKI